MSIIEELDKTTNAGFEYSEQIIKKSNIEFNDIKEKIYKHYGLQQENLDSYEDTYSKNTPKFNSIDVSEMLNESKQWLSYTEQKNNLTPRLRTNGIQKLKYYTPSDIFNLREITNKLPKQKSKAVVLTVNNLKGGVGKTTITTSFAQYLSLQGYRVLLVDADPQATTTSSFNYFPDIHFKGDDTLYGVLSGKSDIKNVILDTHFKNLALLPACLELQNADFYIKNDNDLQMVIKVIEEDFDFIIFDTAPAMSNLTRSILLATEHLIIPLVPSSFDVASTITYFKLLTEQYKKYSINNPLKLKNYSIVVNRFNQVTKEHRQMMNLLYNIFNDFLIDWVINNTTRISETQFNTIYEVDRPKGSKSDDIYTVLDSFNKLFNELLERINRS